MHYIITSRLSIQGIPAVLWGKDSDQAFIAVHGNMSNKEDTVIRLLAEEAERHGYQTISFDLPEYGERSNDGIPCKVQNCVSDLRKVMDFARSRYQHISLFACSMGAYFSLLEYDNEKLMQTLFLSPVVDMKRIIQNMMMWFGVTEDRLKEEQQVETPIGQTLYWDYYRYVLDHPIESWNCATSILYGAKDNLCERDTVDAFVKKFECKLKVLQAGEHYFHTPEQLEFYSAWLGENMR